MKSFFYYLLWAVLVVGLIWLGYWGFFSLGEGTSVVYDASLGTVSEETEVVEPPVIADSTVATEEPEDLPDFLQTPDPIPETVESAIPAEYQDLADSLQKLVDDKVQMKVGSRGTRVGTVQKFLNVFTDKDSRIDNDFGPGTAANIKQFQSSMSITADGQPGPQTYQAMIDWLGQ
jgi:hypothetical protein